MRTYELLHLFDSEENRKAYKSLLSDDVVGQPVDSLIEVWKQSFDDCDERQEQVVHILDNFGSAWQETAPTSAS